MRADRLGSYSTAATTAGMPCLSRLKSIVRYACLCPPPMNREVMRPIELRPPDRFLLSTSDFSGFCLVISSRDTEVMKRREAVCGLYVLIGIFLAPLDLREFGHLLARLQLDVSLLPVRLVAGEAPLAAEFAVHVGGPHFGHLHLEQLFHRGLHLRLVGPAVYFEAQRALVVFPVHALLGDERAAQNLMNGHFLSASENLSAAAADSSTLWCPSRW